MIDVVCSVDTLLFTRLLSYFFAIANIVYIHLDGETIEFSVNLGDGISKHSIDYLATPVNEQAYFSLCSWYVDMKKLCLLKGISTLRVVDGCHVDINDGKNSYELAALVQRTPEDSCEFTWDLNVPKLKECLKDLSDVSDYSRFNLPSVLTGENYSTVYLPAKYWRFIASIGDDVCQLCKIEKHIYRLYLSFDFDEYYTFTFNQE